jgi:hypothetical protein
MALRNGANPVDALEHIRQVRQNTLLQLAYGGGTPQTWRKSVETAYLTGFLDEDHYRTLHTHPELWMDTIRQLQDPKVTAEQDQRMRDQGMSYSHAAHNYAWDTTLHAGAAPEQAGYQKNSDGTYTPLFLTPNERAARAGVPIMGGAPGPLEGGGGGGRPPVPGAPAPGASAAPGAPAPGAPQGTRPFDVYTAAVRTHEGTSPTMGNYGWIPSTKVAMARQYAPEAVKGMSDEQIVAAQLSPDAEEKMMQGFTANNAVKLGEAGIRASGANLGMAHYIGAQGVKNLATVPPDMTMTQMEQNGLLAKGSVAGNRELQGNTTARGFIQWAQRKYGNTTLSADDISGATKVAGPGTPPAATPTATSAAAPAPMYQGKPEVPIGGDTQIAQDQKRIDEDYAAQHEAQLAARQANAPMSMITDLSHRIQNIAPGAGGEFRAEVEEAMREWSPGIVQRWTKWATGHDFNDSSDRFAAMKEFTTLAIAQEAQMPGVRSGLGLTQLNQHASPNINMPEKAIHDLLNAMLVRNQSIKDFAAGFQPLIEPRYQAWRSPTGAMPSPYKPVQPEWEQEWNKASGIHSPRVYQAATDVLNGHDHEDLAKWYGKMSPEQQAEVKRIVRDVDPQYVSPANQHAPAPAQ